MSIGQSTACMVFLAVNCLLFVTLMSKHYDDYTSLSKETVPITTRSPQKDIASPREKVADQPTLHQQKPDILSPPKEKVADQPKPLPEPDMKADTSAREKLDISSTTKVVKCSPAMNVISKDISARDPVTDWELTWKNDTEANQYGCKYTELLEWALTLRYKEKKIFSQQGEDGVLIEIFEKIGVKDMFYVEFGTEEGMECNTRVFRQNYGWKGVLFDMLKSNPSIGLHQEAMWVDTVVATFQKYKVPQKFDLLSVDTDFADFWLLREIMLAGYRPRVIIVEVNVAHGPYASFAVPVKAAQDHTIFPQNRWFGATVLAFSKLMHKFGYQLLYIEKLVVNAIFIKSSEINNIDLARVAWQRQMFAGLDSRIAHRKDPENKAFVHICENNPCDSSDDW